MSLAGFGSPPIFGRDNRTGEEALQTSCPDPGDGTFCRQYCPYYYGLISSKGGYFLQYEDKRGVAVKNR